MRRQHALLLVFLLITIASGSIWILRKDPVTRSAVPLPSHVVAAEDRVEEASAAELVVPDPDESRPETQRGAVPIEARAETEDLPVSSPADPRLTGRVVDGAGRPVEDAEVSLDRRGSGFAFSIGGWGERQKPAFGSTTTDAEGRFEIVSPGEPEVSLEIGRDGFVPFQESIAISVEGDHDLGDLELEQGVRLSGRVLDVTGRGVAEARIAALEPGSDADGFFSIGDRPRLVATTDEQGLFSVDRLQSGLWKLRVTHTDFPSKEVEGETRAPGESNGDLLITLEDGAFIRGRVVDIPAGVDEVRVSARPSATMNGFQAGRSAVVASDGTFELRGLERDETYDISAVAGDFRGLHGPAIAKVEAPAGSRGVEVPFSSPGTITFVVQDQETGMAIESMQVRVGIDPFMMPIFEPNTTPGSGPTAKRHFQGGAVTYSGAPTAAQEAIHISISALGYETYDENFDLEPGDHDLGVIHLRPARKLEVLVLTKDGTPVPRASVRLTEVQEQSFGGGTVMRMMGSDGEVIGGDVGLHGTTDENGIAELSSQPGKRMTLAVTHDEFATFEGDEILIPSKDNFRIEVVLVRGGEVTIVARDENGEPLAGVPIEHRNGEEMLAGQVSGWHGPGSNPITDSNGLAVFEHLPVGEHSFKLGSRGSAPSFGGGEMTVRFSTGGAPAEAPEEGWETVFLDEGSAIEVPLIGHPPAHLEGEVLEGGQPLAGAELTLRDPGPNSGMGMPNMPGLGGGADGRTGGDGLYNIANLEPGMYTLVVTHPGRAMPVEFEVELYEGDNAFDVDLDVAIIEGRVTGPDGRPVVGARVRAYQPSGGEAGGRTAVRMMFVTDGGGGGGGMSMETVEDAAGTVRTDEQGRYVLRGVRPDTELAVRVEAEGFQRAESETVTLNPDQVKTGLDVELEQGVSVEVFVSDAGGAPVSFCLVSASYQGDLEDVTNPGPSMAQEGVASFDGLTPGLWSFSAQSIGGLRPGSGGGGSSEPVEEVLEPGSEPRIELMLP